MVSAATLAVTGTAHSAHGASHQIIPADNPYATPLTFPLPYAAAAAATTVNVAAAPAVAGVWIGAGPQVSGRELVEG